MYDKFLIINNIYRYNPVLVAVFKMPIAALLIWITAIFQAYYFNNGILYALRLDQPTFKKKSFFQLLFLMVLDGVHLMTIGLSMEYWIVKYGLGTWQINTSYDLFNLPIILVLVSYFIVGFLGSGTFRIIDFFQNQSKIPKFNDYRNIFGTVYLLCFLISFRVLFDINFSPIFVLISATMFLTIVVNDLIHRKQQQ